jgi:hypothetical protein
MKRMGEGVTKNESKKKKKPNKQKLKKENHPNYNLKPDSKMESLLNYNTFSKSQNKLSPAM